jgi:hypothetical protein
MGARFGRERRIRVHTARLFAGAGAQSSLTKPGRLRPFANLSPGAKPVVQCAHHAPSPALQRWRDDGGADRKEGGDQPHPSGGRAAGNRIGRWSGGEAPAPVRQSGAREPRQAPGGSRQTRRGCFASTLAPPRRSMPRGLARAKRGKTEKRERAAPTPSQSTGRRSVGFFHGVGCHQRPAMTTPSETIFLSPVMCSPTTST